MDGTFEHGFGHARSEAGIGILTGKDVSLHSPRRRLKRVLVGTGGRRHLV